MQDTDLNHRLMRECEALRQVIEEFTGVSSRWNGTVEVLDSQSILLQQGRDAAAEKTLELRYSD